MRPRPGPRSAAPATLTAPTTPAAPAAPPVARSAFAAALPAAPTTRSALAAAALPASPVARSALAVALLATALLAAPAAAAVRLPAPDPPAHAIRTGELVVTALPELPEGADEVELYLVPESGAPRIRVSPERDAAEGRIVWRMPALSARRARLVLRAGGANAEGEPRASAAFDAAPPGEGELARALAGRSEAGFVLPAGGAAAGPALASGGGPSLLPDPAAPRAAEDAPAPTLSAAAPAAGRGAPFPRAAARALPAGTPLPATPAQVPLRN